MLFFCLSLKTSTCKWQGIRNESLTAVTVPECIAKTFPAMITVYRHIAFGILPFYDRIGKGVQSC